MRPDPVAGDEDLAGALAAGGGAAVSGAPSKLITSPECGLEAGGFRNKLRMLDMLVRVALADLANGLAPGAWGLPLCILENYKKNFKKKTTKGRVHKKKKKISGIFH